MNFLQKVKIIAEVQGYGAKRQLVAHKLIVYELEGWKLECLEARIFEKNASRSDCSYLLNRSFSK